LILLGALLALAIAAPRPLAAESGYHPEWRGVSVGLDYFRSLQSDSMHDMLYPRVGAHAEFERWHVEGDTFLPFLLVDFVVAAIGFLGTGETHPPFWNGLNNKDPNPGRMLILDSALRYALLSKGAHRLDLGGRFDVWWLSPYVKGKRVSILSWNLGPSLGYTFWADGVSVTTAVNLGNAFTDQAAWNPTLGGDLALRARIWDRLGLYVRGRVRAEHINYSNYEPPPYDPSYKATDFDLSRWEPMLALDAGIIVGFGRERR
jgi:hypothetical protein